MKIKTKSGEIIDLAQLRRQWEGNSRNTVYMCGHGGSQHALWVLDSLEAALNAQAKDSPYFNVENMDIYYNGVRAQEEAIRKAIGIIEDED